VNRCGAPVSAPHSSVFARLASGAFYETIVTLTLFFSAISARSAVRLDKKSPKVLSCQGEGEERTSGRIQKKIIISAADHRRFQHHPQDIDIVHQRRCKNHSFPLMASGGLKMLAHHRTHRVIFQKKKKPLPLGFHVSPRRHSEKFPQNSISAFLTLMGSK
jgi:hypothetical protein